MTTDKTEGLSARFRALSQAYPEDVFVPLNKLETREAGGMLISRVSAEMGRHFSKIFTEAADALDAKDKLLDKAVEVIDNIAALADGEDDSDLPDDTGVVVKIGNRTIDFSLTLKDLRAVAMLRRLLS